MDQVRAYRKYWQEHPPTHRLVAAFVGYEGSEKKEDVGSFFDSLQMRDDVQVVKIKEKIHGG